MPSKSTDKVDQKTRRKCPDKSDTKTASLLSDYFIGVGAAILVRPLLLKDGKFKAEAENIASRLAEKLEELEKDYGVPPLLILNIVLTYKAFLKNSLTKKEKRARKRQGQTAARQFLKAAAALDRERPRLRRSFQLRPGMPDSSIRDLMIIPGTLRSWAKDSNIRIFEDGIVACAMMLDDGLKRHKVKNRPEHLKGLISSAFSGEQFSATSDALRKALARWQFRDLPPLGLFDGSSSLDPLQLLLGRPTARQLLFNIHKKK